jgi:hypothetical protein
MSKFDRLLPNVRVATREDQPRVQELQRLLGLRPDTLEDWDHIWGKNLQQLDSGVSIGWVLEVNGVVVGYLGNVALRYFLNGNSLNVAAARGWVVQHKYRKYSALLLLKYFAQKNIDLLINSSSNEVAYKVFTAAGSISPKSQNFSNIYFFIVNRSNFVLAILERYGLNLNLKYFLHLAIVIFLALKKLESLRINKCKKSNNLRVSIVEPRKMSKDYDQFWADVVKHNQGFIADRSREKIEWMYSKPANDSKILEFYINKKMIAYAGFKKFRIIGSKEFKLQLIDFVSLKIDTQITDMMIAEGKQIAKALGVCCLEITGCNEKTNGSIVRLGAFKRNHFPTPFSYKILNKNLLTKNEEWFITLYDGDSAL